jgi:DNA-binding NarL/FixJ family response regulator
MDRETTVLIVDDDLNFSQSAAGLLEDRGYLVVGQATTGEQAVAECERLDPDAVLLDVRLPDCNGVALAATLRAAGARPKILLTSADREAVTPEQLQRSGASGFIPKTELARRDLGTFLKQ